LNRSKNLSIIVPNRQEKRIEEVKEQIRKLYPHAQLIVSDDKEGHGKGITLQRGLWEATNGIVVFINGDMDIHPKEIDKLLDYINYYDIVIGKKNIDGFPLKRKIITKLSRWLIKIMFGLPVTDTQTGLKVFKRYALHNWDTRGFGCDVEILADAHKRGYQMKEVEVEVNSTKNKSLWDLWKTLREVIALKIK
jgi:glycosyltransferase involved in cell wall biosynthesis